MEEHRCETAVAPVSDFYEKVEIYPWVICTKNLDKQ